MHDGAPEGTPSLRLSTFQLSGAVVSLEHIPAVDRPRAHLSTGTLGLSDSHKDVTRGHTSRMP
ncbi:hypothetical protein BOTBODRAFT_57853 [Botryobasidium botryosum FD-172 SS1]|uniref:Uncharacterized protein n=1 Tax=Botryobasidium botryosum (strain FD-172 SS1) TaxID=930990 RepID=A0A067MG55_BOTB1|nr:hypothetical protein BOTBODRAFT_57853 [Botryobasidium botryosum FD-172 SS1]